MPNETKPTVEGPMGRKRKTIDSQAVIVVTRIGSVIDVRSFASPEAKDRSCEEFTDQVVALVRSVFESAGDVKVLEFEINPPK